MHDASTPCTQEKGHINLNVLWVAASLVMLRCFHVFSKAQRERGDMQNELSLDQYHKLMGSEDGVVETLMGVSGRPD